MNHCAIYISSASTDFDPDSLSEIARRSSINNKPLNVTGMLLYSGTHFLQVLEGEEFLVQFVMKRIKNDTRHIDLEVIMDSPVEERNFSDWYMGALDISGSKKLDREQFRFITDQAVCDPKAAGRAALKVLKLFRNELPDPLAQFK